MATKIYFRTLAVAIVCGLLLLGTVTSDPPGSCGLDWIFRGDYCYRLSSGRLSQSAAVTECRKWSAVLIRVYSADAEGDFLSITNSSLVTRWWTDLNDHKLPGIWVWGKTGYNALFESNVLIWNTEPDDSRHLENCGAINIQGALSDERCGDRHGYICEYAGGLSGTRCQDGWTSYQAGCYYFAGEDDPFNLVTWSDANRACANSFASTTIHVSNIRPHLIYLETATEQAFIRRQLPLQVLSAQMWWIGMTDNRTEGHFLWGDDGAMATTNTLTWAREPNNLGGSERCGAIYANGKFADLSCNSIENYICMKETNMDGTSLLSKLGCPSGWVRAGGSCYRLDWGPPLSWQDAGTSCQRAGASLLKVDSMDEKVWLEAQALQFERSHWTGLNVQQDRKTWLWADGTPADPRFFLWTKEPNDFQGSEDCGVIYQSGTFNDIPCLTPSRFICESQTEDTPCPSGWLQYSVSDQTNCYYISNSTATVTNDEAHAQCSQMSFPKESYLWAANTKDELNYIISQLQKLAPTTRGWFTGLTDKINEGFWSWDTSFNQPPLDKFIPWSAMPLFPTGKELCGLMAYRGEYVNKRCTLRAPYICEKPAHGSAGIYTPSHGSAGMLSSVGSRFFINQYATSSCLLVAIYFLSYGLCVHYILHVMFVM